ncbi:hypothetical protein [Flavobacterium solisilvae]|uniref:DUF4348 domain-containing protein n=1 Tax=Flavobacterium solisilvae TaxID=1852019 RepID=A0ABX1QT57_9FLAO|nr:hypothetical protein [Flavobacterium solisilvae]NMH24883.1 hypothetical protein [Flavobacterium solisilvae]
MKKITILLILISLNSFCQSKESLQASTKKLYDSNYLMEFETLADLTYPKVFEEIGREAFIEKMDLDYQNEEYRLRLQLPNVTFQYSELKKSGGKSFYIITFKNPVRYFFEEKLTTEQAAEKKKQLQEINQTQDVTFEPARNSFNVKKTTTYVAISDENTSGEWKFFNFDDKEQREFFEKEFPSLFQELKSK